MCFILNGHLNDSKYITDDPTASTPDPAHQSEAATNPGDLLTCGLCGQEFPLPNLAAFIGHKSFGTCRRRRDADAEGSCERRLGSPSVTASDQVERVESSGGGGEEDEEAETAAGRRGTAGVLADAATNTASGPGIN
jgi:hypothetical protein